MMSKGLKTGLIVSGIVVAVLIFTAVFAAFGFRGTEWGWSMMGPGMMGSFGWGWIMILPAVIFWGLIIWGIVALVRYSSSPGRHNESALEVLKLRYAHGEISKQEYEEKKKDLV